MAFNTSLFFESLGDVIEQGDGLAFSDLSVAQIDNEIRVCNEWGCFLKRCQSGSAGTIEPFDGKYDKDFTAFVIANWS